MTVFLKCIIFFLTISSLSAQENSFEDDWRKSLSDAGKSYHFQIPLYAGLASLVLFDGEVSNKASENTPLFGSTDNAKKASDGLLFGLAATMVYSSFFPQLRDSRSSETASPRTKFVLTQTSIIMLDFLIIHGIKTSTKRIRPDDSDNLSFPSGHSSISSGLSRTIFNNVKHSSMSKSMQGKFLQRGAFTMSVLVAWARVEAKKHHLSDVLLGNALGAYISDVLYSVYYKHYEVQPILSIEGPDEVSLSLKYNF